MTDPTNDIDIDALLRRIERYDLFGFKGHGDMLYRLANALEYLDAQAHSMQRAQAHASIADMRDLVIPIGKTLSDAKAALIALVAERDELKEKAKMLDTVIGERDQYEAITNDLRIQLESARSFWRDRAERRDAEAKSAADRDLRERLVCAALTGVCADPNMNDPDIARFAGDIADAAVAIADATLAAMRKGEA